MDGNIDVICQIAADIGRVDDGLNAMVEQVIRWTNAGEHQQLRRSKSALTDDNFALRSDDRTVKRLNTHRAGSVHDNLCDLTMGENGQVAGFMGEVSDGRRLPNAL